MRALWYTRYKASKDWAEPHCGFHTRLSYQVSPPEPLLQEAAPGPAVLAGEAAVAMGRCPPITAQKLLSTQAEGKPPWLYSTSEQWT